MLLQAELVAARLRDLGVLSPPQFEAMAQEVINTQERFSALLVRQRVLRDPEAGKRLALQLGLIPQRFAGSPRLDPPANQVPLSMWCRHRLIPIGQEQDRLRVVTDDPFSVFALPFFERQCGCSLEAVLIREQDMAALVATLGQEGLSSERPAGPDSTGLAAGPVQEATPPQQGRAAAGASPQSADTAQSRRRPEAATTPLSETRLRAPGAEEAWEAARHAPAAAQPPLSLPEGQTEDAPIIALVDAMLSEAVRLRASDIHLEPGSQQMRVRYRIDGVLREVNSPPRALHGPIVSRMKIMSSLNIAEKRLPQDGRLQLAVEGRPLDVRLSTLPATHGEAIVMRLLDRSQPLRGFAEVGMAAEHQQRWEAMIRRPHGMALVTGPTGSGKTTTLYSSLALLNQPDRKLITIEDPVEYQLPGVNQVPVKPIVGLTFAAGLRAMLRQAPDVIMVGEIRDQETAQIAVQAALTGHLILSTLHTNDAASAVTRLIDMGVPPFLVASTVQGVLAQRLVRRICPACRITDHATAEERAFLGEPAVAQVIRSNGCDRCHGSGLFGRIGLFELLAVSEAIRQLIVARATASALRGAAIREGMRSLKEDGCAKVREGLTTVAEVLRVVAEA